MADEALKARLRAYLKSSVDLVLRQDDFNGDEKANLASSIAQVGNPEDMRLKEPAPLELRDQFSPVPQSSPAALPLDPRGPAQEKSA